ncbi:phosphate transport system permease protein [Lentzea albidocapillata subsp. violacea]|uniref:Phosphate transport system permease protein n=1 Tax=Lentzea albidocapillata subsp. violacea TaxID=128104 RepID=A0A1G9YEZ7_9PSEU|nr:phosphate ABC transporter permease subunit PstC [Lentzea albidocapillata]SDN07051.1 phosphate transport system permease protein [Lentzea albidocapillata subsp. violacea]
MSTKTRDGGRPESGGHPVAWEGPPVDLTAQSPRIGEKIIKAVLVGAAALSVLVTVGIVASLFAPVAEFFTHVSVGEFLFGTEWTALFGDKFNWDDKSWGVLPLVTATLMITLISLVVAVPFGLGAAIYLSEYASQRVRKIFKPILEILAGVPTVVYGFLALTVITPILKPLLGIEGIYSMISPGIVMGFMIVPTVASLSEDAMSAVPLALRQGSYALGANRMQTTVRVVFPAALSGIVAAVVLGISRAIGETMIVAIAAGNMPLFTADPLKGAQTMTGFIAQAASGDTPHGSPSYYALFAIGALLFVMTLLINMISIRLVRKYRQAY